MLVITGYYEILDLFQEIDSCDNLLSILDPETPPLKSQVGQFVEHFRELYFHDISKPEQGLILPNRYHIDQIIQWAKTCSSHNGMIVSGAGMGRSPAAALISLCEWGYPVDKAVKTLRDLKPLACPNCFMLKLYGNSDLESAVIQAGFYDEDFLFEHHPLYIFLNLDNVLIRQTSEKLALSHDELFQVITESLDLLEDALRFYHNYRIVVVSQWLKNLPLEKICSYFSYNVVENIVDILSEANLNLFNSTSQNIQQYIEDNQLHQGCWVIIDDISKDYPPDTSVIRTESDIGFDRQAAELLVNYLEIVS